MRRVLLIAGVAAAVTLGCTAQEPDVAALGDLDQDTCLPVDPMDDPPDAVAGVTADDEERTEEVAEQVANIRELAWDEVPVPVLIDPPRLREVIEMVRSTDPLDVERRLLAAVGAAPADLDLQAAITDFEASRAGYYLWEPPQVLVRQDAEGELTPGERMVLAHEFTHALADQRIGMPQDAMTGAEGDTDAALAAHALVEGEAVVVESLWASLHLPADDRPDRLDLESAASGDGDLPHLVQRRAAFPYVEGRAFVCDLYREGGWEAVDALYDDLPATTAQILTGAAFEVSNPPAVTAPGEPAEQWVEIGNATVGAAELTWHFEAPGDDTDAALDDPQERALAWAGGEVTVWTDTATGEEDVVALSLVDNGEAATSLCDSIDAWQTAAFPDADRSERTDGTLFDRGDVTAVLRCDGDEVVLGIAADGAVAEAVTAPDG